MPYPGLRAFRREEADVFFGRDDCIDDMVDKLAATRFLAVLGASGSGKSSLVRTGMLHALALGFNIRAGSNWMIAEMQPGNDPLRALATGLLAATGASFGAIEVDLLADQLRGGPSAIVQWCRAGHLPPGYNLLIMADQFEELFRFRDYGEHENAEAFVNLLLRSTRSEEVPINVVLTMRSEFLAACALFDGLAERINAGLYLTPRMTREACENAIIGPAMVCGFTVEPALVNRVLNDITALAPWDTSGDADQNERLSRRADQLPLMQHVLNAMWLDASTRGAPVVLTEAEYDAIGGLTGALDRHGASIIAQLGEGAEGAAESVFRALVAGSSATLAVRRPTKLDDIVALAQTDRALVERVIDAFRAPDCNFLQPPLTVPLGGDTVIDLSHESLIRQWSRLAEWTAKEARSAESWRRLNAATAREANGEGGLLQGLDLATVSAWWDAERPGPVWQARFGGDHAAAADFLSRSRAAHDAIENARAEAEARERRGLRRRAAIYAGLALLSTTSGAIAVLQSQQSLTSEQGKVRAEQAKVKAEKDKVKAEQDKVKAEKDKVRAEKQTVYEQKNTIKALTLAKRREAAAAAEARARASAEADAARARVAALSAKLNEANTALQNKALKGAVAELGALVPQDRNVEISEKTRKTRDEVLQDPEIKVLANFGVRSNSPEQKLSLESLAAPQRAGNALPTDTSGKLRGFLLANVRAALDARIEPDVVARTRESLDRLMADYNRLRPIARRRTATTDDLAEFGRVADDYARLSYSVDPDADVTPVITAMTATVKQLRQRGGTAAARDLDLRIASVITQIVDRTDEADGKAADQNWDRQVAVSAKAPDPTENERVWILIGHRVSASNMEQSDPNRVKAMASVCAEAEAAVRAYPMNSFIQRQLVRCRWEQVPTGPEKGYQAYTKINADTRDLLRTRPADQILGFTLFQGLVRQARLIWRDKERGLPLRRQALAALDTAIANRPLETDLIGQNIGDIRDVYSWDFPSRDEEITALLRAERALLSSGTAYPRSNMAYYLADVRRKLGEALLRQPAVEDEGYRYFDRADANYRATGRLAKLTKSLTAKLATSRPAPAFTEDFADICGVTMKRARRAAERGDANTAIAIYGQAAPQCEVGLNAYPFDIYLRLPIISAQAEIGAALNKAKRFADARPYLEYASTWGEASSSRLLAGQYADGQGVARDKNKAEVLRQLANRQSTMKRFTVPSSTKDGKDNYPFNVYVREWPAVYYEPAPKGLGLTGIRDQEMWLEEARGLKIGEDVLASFDKLQKIARDNKVSFPDLTVYALGAAQAEEKDGSTNATAEQAKPIAAAIRAENFTRGLDLATDQAGVILNGFDPVGYFDSGKAVPSDARFFTLWRGAIWLFANDANRRKFLADPARYVPAYGGYCATCMAAGDVTASDPRQFAIHEGRLYLFSSQTTRERWLAETKSYVDRADAIWKGKDYSAILPTDSTKLGNFISQELKASAAAKSN